MDRKKYEYLTEMFLEGTITENDARKLLKAIEQSAELEETLYRDAVMDAVLTKSLNSRKDRTCTRVMASLRDSEEKKLLRNNIMRDLPDKRVFPAQEDTSTVLHLKWLKIAALFAGAAFLIIFSFSFINNQDIRDTRTRIVKRIGDVNISKDSINTGKDSFYRTAHEDGTQLLVNADTELSMSIDEKTGAKQIDLKKGGIFLDVTKQKHPLTVRLGNAQVEVLGTRLMADNSDTPSVSVFKGKVRFSESDTACHLYGGQYASLMTNKAGKEIIRVQRLVSGNKNLSWLSRLDINEKDLECKEYIKDSKSNVDYNDYSVFGGEWDVHNTPDGMIVKQNDIEAQAAIVFGTPRWKKAKVMCTIRAVKAASEKFNTGFRLLYPNGLADECGHENVFKRMRERHSYKDGWIEIFSIFKIGKNNNLKLIKTGARLPHWDKDQCMFFKYKDEDPHTPETSSIKTRECFATGFYTDNCVMEFKDLRLEETE